MANPFDQFDAPSANPFDQFDAPAAPEQPKPSSLARRALGDTAVSLAKGVVGTGDAAVGLADLATGGYAGKALSDATGFNPKATKAALDSLYSPEQQKANQAVQGAEGFGNTLGAIARNPSVALQAIAESAPAMLGGGAVAQGIGKIGLAGNALARGALGEGIVGAGQQAEQFRQDNPEGTLNGRQTLASLASGAGTAAFSGLGGKVAQKLGIGDIDTVLAGGAGKIAPQSLARRMGEGVVSEGMLEEMPQSVWEQGAQNFGNDKPLTEGTGNAAAMGLVTGGMMGAGFNALQSPTRQPQGKPMQPPADLATKPPANPLATPGENIALQQQILDEQEQLAASINPADGPLSSAASLAVQTGAAKTPTQLAIEHEQQRAAELAAQQDDAESEIYNSTGIEDQADNLDWMRLLSGEQADLADLRDKAQFEAKQRQSRQAGELRDAKDQMLAEGAYEADQRRAQQQAQQAANPGLPFERIAPEDYDTINPVKLGEGEIVRDEPRQLPPPRQQNALPPGNRAAPALGFTPKAPDPMQATEDGLVGTARQFDELRAMKRERKDQMRRASELAQSLVRQGATLQGKSLVAPSGRVLAPQLTLPQYRAVSDALKQNQTNAQQNATQAAPAQAQQAETQGQEQPSATQPVAPSPENQDGTVRPASGGVSDRSDSQGSVDAGGVVDNRADRGSGYERAGEGDATAKPASRVPGAGTGGKRAKPANLLKIVRDAGGVSAARKNDVAQDSRAVGVFRSGGMELDSLAELLHQNGFLTDADVSDSTSGAEKAVELLREAIAGNRPLNMADNERAMSDAQEAEHKESIRKRADALGIKWRFRKIDDVEKDVAEAETRAALDEDSSAYDIESVSGSVQDVLDEFDTFYESTPLRGESAMRAMGFTEEEIREAIQSQDAERQDRGTQSRGQEASRQADRAQDREQAEVLESYTEQDLAARDEAQRLAAETSAKQEKAADDKARADAERDSFTLAGSDRPADVMAAMGQGGLFDQPAAINQSPIKNETRANAGPTAETAPADQEAIKGRAESLREPRPLDFTPKQYHEARIKWVAQEYGLSDAEARLDYDTPAARKDDEQAWADAVRQAFKDGAELTRATLDKLEEIRPGAFMSNLHDYPEAKIPNGYQLPAARKAENDFADARREDRRKAAEKRAAESSPEPSPLATIFSDLDSTSTRKANKASRAAQSHPKAAEIDYVQKNFHDVLLRLMEEGKLTVNGVSSVSEENSKCL